MKGQGRAYFFSRDGYGTYSDNELQLIELFLEKYGKNQNYFRKEKQERKQIICFYRSCFYQYSRFLVCFASGRSNAESLSSQKRSVRGVSFQMKDRLSPFEREPNKNRCKSKSQKHFVLHSVYWVIGFFCRRSAKFFVSQ